MSQSAHQRRSFRGEAMPATWSLRLVSLRLRKSECFIVERIPHVGLLGSQAKAEALGCKYEIFYQFDFTNYQDRSDALSLTRSATAVTCLLQMSRNPA